MTRDRLAAAVSVGAVAFAMVGAACSTGSTSITRVSTDAGQHPAGSTPTGNAAASSAVATIGCPGDRSRCESECSAGVGKSCFALGKGATIVSTPEEQKEGLSFLARACELKVGEACVRAADLTVTSASQKEELLNKGCDAGDVVSCTTLSGVFQIAKNPVKQVAALDRACALEPGWCAASARVYLDPASGVTDVARGTSAAIAVCATKFDASFCPAMVTMLRDGWKALKPDAARAASILGTHCDRGSASACAMLGSMRRVGAGVPKDASAAIAEFEKSCKPPTESVGCGSLGDMVALGEGTPKDEKRAKQIWSSACTDDKGNVGGCFYVARELENGKKATKADRERALQLYQRVAADWREYVDLPENRQAAERMVALGAALKNDTASRFGSTVLCRRYGVRAACDKSDDEVSLTW